MTALILGAVLGLAGLALLVVATALARPAPTTVLGVPLDDAATPEALRLLWGYDPASGATVPMGRYHDGTAAFLTTPPPRRSPPLWVQFPPPGVVVHHITPSGKSFAPWWFPDEIERAFERQAHGARVFEVPDVVIAELTRRTAVLVALRRLGHPDPTRRALPRGTT